MKGLASSAKYQRSREARGGKANQEEERRGENEGRQGSAFELAFLSSPPSVSEREGEKRGRAELVTLHMLTCTRSSSPPKREGGEGKRGTERDEREGRCEGGREGRLMSSLVRLAKRHRHRQPDTSASFSESVHTLQERSGRRARRRRNCLSMKGKRWREGRKESRPSSLKPRKVELPVESREREEKEEEGNKDGEEKLEVCSADDVSKEGWSDMNREGQEVVGVGEGGKHRAGDFVEVELSLLLPSFLSPSLVQIETEINQA